MLENDNRGLAERAKTDGRGRRSAKGSSICCTIRTSAVDAGMVMQALALCASVMVMLTHRRPRPTMLGDGLAEMEVRVPVSREVEAVGKR
ncbi:hypothetical protein K523DRAFT_137779 [Schizophyllum commune Tattone D]|nr:hypothetical protein K523DRAFT_137779 [Schizophyllum commune Tattone D]